MHGNVSFVQCLITSGFYPGVFLCGTDFRLNKNSYIKISEKTVGFFSVKSIFAKLV